MKNTEGQADQFSNWSARKHEGISGTAAQAAAGTCHTVAVSRPAGATRVTDRAGQAVWQAPLPGCPARAWPQVLSVREQRWEATGDGVRPPGCGRASQAAAGESAGISGGLGGALRHQSGAAEAAGRAVVRQDASPQPQGSSRPYRGGRGGPARGQHAGTGAERRPLARGAAGGDKRCRRR